MKKLLLLLLIIGTVFVTVSFGFVNLGSEVVTSGQYTYKMKNDSSISIIRYQIVGDEKGIFIPNYLDGYEVTSIESNAFDCQGIEEIEIANSITHIEDNAFTNCYDVKTLHWPTHLVTFKPFVGLENLTTLIICFGNNGMMADYTSEYIHPWSESFNSISELIIDDGINYIGAYGFANLVALKHVILPESIQSIGRYCFYNDDNIVDLKLPYKLTSFSEGCFASSNEVEKKNKIILPQNVSYLGKNCFSNNYTYFAYKDSKTAKYLDNNHIPFEEIDFNFSNDSYKIKLGQEIDIGIKNLDNDLTDEITYYSSDASIASISNDGLLSSNASGSVTITASTFTGSTSTIVNIEHHSDNQAKYQLLSTGDKFNIDVSEFNDFTNEKGLYHFTSLNNNILSVNNDGVVTALRKGYGTILISNGNKDVEYLFKVSQLVKDIKLPDSNLSLHKGQSYQINPTVAPNNADNKKLSYTSSDEDVVVVNKNGKITALNFGSCIVSVCSNDGSNVKQDIIVNVSTTTISVPTKSIALMVNKPFRLRGEVSDNSKLFYSSNNEDICTVDRNGVLHPVNVGNCLITISNQNNTSFTTVNVQVYQAFSYGIDISRWNGNYLTVNNFKDAIKDGVDFVYIRAGYSSTTKDKNFERNYENARQAGLDIGAYQYSMAQNAGEALLEAQQMLKWINGKKFEYPIMIDIEDKSQKYMDKETWNSIVKIWCDTLSKEGYEVIIYSYASMLNKNKTDYDCWVAQWHTISPYTYKGDYTIWQFTDYGKINGFKSRVDMNLCFYDYPSYIKENHLNGY